MKFSIIISILFSITTVNSVAQSQKIIIVTLDGMRWQEVFKGIDPALLTEKKYVTDSSSLSRQFWSDNLEERRKKLFPFLWTTIANEGQLLGNRTYGNLVNCSNPYQFSYPGYNEIFTGYPDTLVNSNAKIWNSNVNVLEFLHQQKRHKGRVAAFTTWDVFPFILNKSRSGIYVNADLDSIKFPTTELRLINEIQFLSTRPIGVRPDVFTYFAAREYLKKYKPDVLYIAFDETDDFAHGGRYDQYIMSAHAEDRMMEDLWRTIQAMPEYRNNTSLIITTDHGRGDYDKKNWQHHGERIRESGEIWLAAIGPSIVAKGEVKTKNQVFQKQLAATIAGLMGHIFITSHPVASPIIFD